MAGTIDDEVKALIDRAYAQGEAILKENEEKLHALVDYLLEKESMTAEQFEGIMEGKEVGNTSATAMFDGFEEAPVQTEPKKTEE